MREEFGAPSGPASLIGTRERAIPQLAALVNGAVGHALDYDDTNNLGGFQPTAPILPAALATAEVSGRADTDLLMALIVGVEIGARFGVAIGPEHYDKAGTRPLRSGCFGATAAVSWLLGLDHEQFGYAVGLAASQSAGARANFATMTKPCHAGFAAERGLVSARLGKRRFVSNPAAFEDVAGLIDAAGTGEIHQQQLASVGEEWAVTRTLFKYHAACHGTHAAIESARLLLHDVDPADIRSVLVTVHLSIADLCKIVHPKDGLQAKFSVRAATALAILGDDTADPATFNDRRVQDSDLRELIDRIDVTASTGVTPTSAIVRFDTPTGSHEATFDIGTPESDRTLQERRLRSKFDQLVAPVIGERARNLADQLLDFVSVPRVADLLG